MDLEKQLEKQSFENLVKFFEAEIIAIHEKRANIAEILNDRQARKLRKCKILASVRPSKYGGKRVIVTKAARQILRLD